MSEDLKPALRTASEALHKIAMALTARRLKTTTKNAVMHAKFEKDALTDEQIIALAGDGFEAAVLALRAAGATDVTVFTCGKKDVSP